MFLGPFILIDIVILCYFLIEMQNITFCISCKMVYSEKTRIWLLIKKSLPQLNKANINPIEFLIWTQGKNIREVRNRILIIQNTIASEDSWIGKKDNSENNPKLFPLKNKKEEDDDFNLGDTDDIIEKVFLAR